MLPLNQCLMLCGCWQETWCIFTWPLLEQKQIVSLCFSVTQTGSFWNNFFFCKFWKSTPWVVLPLLCLRNCCLIMLPQKDALGQHQKSSFGVAAQKSWDLCKKPPPLEEWDFLPILWKGWTQSLISCCLCFCFHNSFISISAFSVTSKQHCIASQFWTELFRIFLYSIPFFLKQTVPSEVFLCTKGS